MTDALLYRSTENPVLVGDVFHHEEFDWTVSALPAPGGNLIELTRPDPSSHPDVPRTIETYVGPGILGGYWAQG